MANNLVDFVASLQTENPKRSNWNLEHFDVGTNTFGFIKVKKVKEVPAGSSLRYDFRSAYSTNPTISPVLSRAKVSVCALWVPLSLYVPAFRDGVTVKAGKTDFSLPVMGFDYSDVDFAFNSDNMTDISLLNANGAGLPYVPANSIFSELGMWRPYYQPVSQDYKGVDQSSLYKNAIPLLGYYDFFRHYVYNTQSEYFPVRVQGWSVQNSFVSGTDRRVAQDPIDVYKTKESLDDLFTSVRRLGLSYPSNGTLFDISQIVARFLGGISSPNSAFPSKKMYVDFPDSGVAPNPESLVAFNDDHYGEVRQTYLGDFYTSYLSNENVEYERSTARVVADDDGVITMEQLYLAQRVQNFIRRTIFKNSDYAEFIDAQAGVTPPTTLNKPLFLGMVSTWLNFNDVTSTAQTSDDSDVDSNSALGSRSSIGFGRMVTGSLRGNGDRPFVHFTAREPGYFMVLEWIVPEVAYFQGYDPLYSKHSLEDIYFPAFDRIGYQDKHFKYLNEQVQNSAGWRALPPFRIDDYNIAYAQEPAWFEYMTTFNRMSGQMVDEGVYRHWVFHREVDPGVTEKDYQSDVIPQDPDLFTGDPLQTITDIYVKPEDFVHIFSNEQGLDNFQTYYRHDLKLYQPISHRFLSF